MGLTLPVRENSPLFIDVYFLDLPYQRANLAKFGATTKYFFPLLPCESHSHVVLG